MELFARISVFTNDVYCVVMYLSFPWLRIEPIDISYKKNSKSKMLTTKNIYLIHVCTYFPFILYIN